MMYPYEYTDSYDQGKIDVMRDTDGYPFVIHSGKRLYLPNGWSREKCQRYYNNLRIEQDKDCTHCYFTDPKRYPDEKDIVADIGAAEGIFGLDVIDRIKMLYLFEGDEKWNIPLSRTFEPWKEKVVIVNKFLSDRDQDNHVSLDNFFAEKDVTYIKADIEGDEEIMLRGAVRLLDSGIKALICIYHKPGDESSLKEIMTDHGFSVEINPGYLLMTNVDGLFRNRYLRHGVLFAHKE